MSLILTRRPGEAVIVRMPDGRELRIAVNDRARSGSGVSLKLDGPADVVFIREELLEAGDTRYLEREGRS